ncbi:hypothetical protein DVK02_02630 [Halobellus sp. Atlit-31R]|nr:hypothetical protein DVK02_02630 [Halobellus sp. Atlit-31R]
MAEDAVDSETTAPCDRCDTPISTDAERCPVCGYQPAGYNPRLLRVGEVVFATTITVSVLVFVAGVTGIAAGLLAVDLSKAAIVTPYTAGISGFFLYYVRNKRRASPTDSEILDRNS